MYNFYIVEVRELPNKEYEHNIHFVYDNDEHIAQLKGESKYYDIRSKAATSVANGNTIKYSTILFNSNAFPILHGSYEKVSESNLEEVNN